MHKFEIKIQNEIFTTKTSLENRCKEILNSYKNGQKLNIFDESFMIDFFTQLARSYKLKGMPIASICVRTSKENKKNNTFWIQREDNSMTDISYRKCIYPPKMIEEIQDACRNAIYKIKNEYKKSQTYPRKSALSDVVINNASEAEVDHYDLDFVDLVKNWVQESGGEEYIFSKICETLDGVERTEFTDSTIIDSFIKYHNAHTHLRIVTKEENRKRQKSKIK